MAKEYSRTLRIAGLIQRELSQILHHEVKDLRLKLVNISDVEVTRDLSYAKIFFTMLDEKKSKDTLVALTNASGHLRSILAKRIDIRTIPKLQFVFDDSMLRGNKISNLIDEAIARDKDLKG